MAMTRTGQNEYANLANAPSPGDNRGPSARFACCGIGVSPVADSGRSNRRLSAALDCGLAARNVSSAVIFFGFDNIRLRQA